MMTLKRKLEPVSLSALMTSLMLIAGLVQAQEQLDNVVEGSSDGGVLCGEIISEDGLAVPNAPSAAVNSGMLDSPAYYSRLEECYFNMTYNTGSQIPLSFALGVGEGSNFWHRNTSVVVSQIENERPSEESLVVGRDRI